MLLVQRTLEFVKQEALKFLETRMRASDVNNLKINWVITVPAIWCVYADAVDVAVKLVALKGGTIRPRPPACCSMHQPSSALVKVSMRDACIRFCDIAGQL